MGESATGPKPEDVHRMNQIERDLLRFCEQFRDNTEAAVVAGAFVRVTRFLYEKYPPEVRAMLVEGAIAFLQRRDVDQEQREAELRKSGFYLPPGGMLQ